MNNSISFHGPEALRISLTYLTLTPPQKRLVDVVVDSYGPIHRSEIARAMQIDESALRGLLIAIGRHRTKYGCRHTFLSHDQNDKDAYFLPVWVKDAIRAARTLYGTTVQIAARKQQAA